MAESKFVDQLMALYGAHRLEQVARSFCLADREERKARLRAVMALSVELERIKAESIFGTGLAEGVIEDIIEGNWRAALDLGMTFTFADEREDLRVRESTRWAKFVEIVRVECALGENRAKAEPGESRPD